MARHPSEILKSGPKYRVAPECRFHDGWVMHEEGDELFWDGEPGPNLIPVSAEAKAKVKAMAGRRAAATPAAPATPEPQAGA